MRRILLCEGGLRISLSSALTGVLISQTNPHAHTQEGGANLSRFTGSSAISSDDYFGRAPNKGI